MRRCLIYMPSGRPRSFERLALFNKNFRDSLVINYLTRCTDERRINKISSVSYNLVFKMMVILAYNKNEKK